MKIVDTISHKEMVELISTHEVFSELSKESQSQLEKIVEYVSVSKNEDIFSVGQQPNLIYYLVSGALELYFPDNTSLELEPGELIGEIGLLNGDFRIGTLTANADSQVISICGKKLFDTSFISADTSLHIIRVLSKRVTNYLRSEKETSTQEFIKNGESDRVEFKSTLRWNIHSKKRDKAITQVIVKTIAAFLNTEGGILLVGVADDGSILGLDSDNFENDDKLFLFLTNTIKSHIGAYHLPNIHFHIENIDDKDILRVDVHHSDQPCYVTYDNEEHFFIRTGPSTTPLKISKVYDYVKGRFPS